jgi:hypothetical protein
VSASDDHYARMSENEKLRLIDELLSRPDSPIPPQVIPNLPKESKLELLDEIIKDGILKWEK